MERVTPFIEQYSRQDDDELREYCLQAFEAFVQRCPKEMTPHISSIMDLCLNCITYDPNYNYDDTDADDSVRINITYLQKGKLNKLIFVI